MKPEIIIRCLLLLFSNSYKTQAQAAGNDTLNYAPPGKLYDIGGYRLHLHSTGNGRFTIVLIAGAFGYSFDWSLVQQGLSKTAKVCSYDRPGLAWSDIGPLPHTFAQDAYELHKLLKTAKIKPPYIMVGQSVGGLIARQYAREYPSEVNGMILVDATSENGLFGVKGKIERMRLLASAGKSVPPVKEYVDTFTTRIAQERINDFLKISHPIKITRSPVNLQDSIQHFRSWAQALPKSATAEGDEFWAEEFAAIYSDSIFYKLADKPLIVVTSTKNEYPKGWDMRDSMMEEKLQNQKRFLTLSNNSKLITTENSGHEIHIREPELVEDAVMQVIEAIKNKSKLK